MSCSYTMLKSNLHKMKICTVLVLSLFVCASSGAKLPETFPRCKVSPELDNKPNECLIKAIQKSIDLLTVEGNQELGVSDLDPLKISKIFIEKGESSPIAIKLEYTDNDLIGLTNLRIKSVNGKLSSAKDFKMVIEAYVDEIHLKGPYSISGRVLILPIQGVGQSHMKLDKLLARLTLKGEPRVKNGKEYLRITNSVLELAELGRLNMSFTNLFNGDKALGDNMNKFLNENWKDIYQELKPSIEGAFNAIFEAYTKRVMERIQYKNIFITE